MATDIVKFGRELNHYVDKKYFSKGTSIWVLQRRVMSTAIQCLTEAEDSKLDASEVFVYLFHFAEEASKDVEYIIKLMASQIELLFPNEEKFAKTLYRFFSDFADEIKHNNQYETFFMAFTYVQEHAKNGILVDEVPTIMAPVTNILLNLFFELLEFLRPNKYNINEMVVGLSTEGKILTIRDPYPMTDVPLYHIEKLAETKKFSSPEEFQMYIRQEYEKYGFSGIDSEYAINSLQGENNFLNNMMYSLIQYINEYTIDMLPEKPFQFPFDLRNWKCMLYAGTKIEAGRLVELAKHKRKRTLPANGAVVVFNDMNTLFSSLSLKEVYNNDAIVLLYKVTSEKGGDISGYFNTKTGMFWSPFYNATLYVEDRSIDVKGFENVVQDLVLWAYVAFVCDDAGAMPTQASFQSSFQFPDNSLPSVSFFGVGGKLRNQLSLNQNDAGKVTLFDRSQYQEAERPINGFVRRLPVGQKASEKAKLLAESLGFELSEDETYVQPFIRRQWLKAAKS